MLEFAHGYFEWNNGNALNSVINIVFSTGANGRVFQPKAIRLWTFSDAFTTLNPPNPATQRTDLGISVGFASSTTSRACVASFSADTVATSDCSAAWSNTSCVLALSGAAIIGKLDLNAINSDGFDLIVDQAITGAQNYVVYWEAWGGSDITNVTIGAIAEPGTTGAVSYTATGFEATSRFPDQCIMFAGNQTISATDVIGANNDAGVAVGYAVNDPNDASGAQEIVLVGNSDENSATSDTDGYIRTTQCLAKVAVAGGNINSATNVSSMNNGSFSLGWQTRALTNRRNIYMAIKGGRWQTGAVTINATVIRSTATAITGFMIRGGLFFGRMTAESAANTTTAQNRMSFGSLQTNYPDMGVATTSQCQSIFDVNAQANMLIYGARDLGQANKTVLIYTDNAGNVITTHEASIVSNQLTVEVGTAGGVNTELVGYLLFGDSTIMTSVGHPFIA